MNFYILSALINVITSSILGLLIFSADRQSRVNQLFALFAASIAWWSYAYFRWQMASDPGDALWWTHMLMAGAIFIAPVYLHFTVRFLDAPKHFRVVVGGYLIASIFSILNWTPWFIVNVVPRAGFSFWPTAGALYLPFLILWFACVIYATILLVVRLRQPELSKEQSRAIRLMLIGMIIGYTGGASNYFLWYDIPIPPVGNVFVSMYVAFVAIAIMKHRLFNMKVLATELLTFALWLALFIRVALDTTFEDRLVDSGLLALTLILGTFLIRSVDKEVEQRELIEKQKTDLEQANRRQESFLHFMSHEVKGYFTRCVVAFSSIVDGDYGTPTPELRAMSTEMLHNIQGGVQTIMDILEAANLRQGAISLKKKSFDFKAAVHDAIEDALPASRAKGLTISAMFSHEQCLLYGDEEKVRRHIIRNLIENAITYTQHGMISVDLTRAGDEMRLSVKDSGIGITPEDMRHLFTEGGRGKDSLRYNAHSTGYGLAIARQIVEAHGGKIWAESEGQGKGSRFVVVLPIFNGTM